MKAPEENQTEYVSNPFVLAYRATKRLFDTNRGWAILLLVLGIFSGASNLNGNNTSQPSSNAVPATNADTSTTLALIVLITSLVMIAVIVAVVVGTYMQGILTYTALQSEKNNKVKFSEAMQATSQRFWQLLGAYLLAGLKVLGWTFLFIIPGIIAAFRYSLLSYVIMDEKAEDQTVKKSHDRIKALTKNRLWEVAGISFTGITPFFGMLFDLTGKAALYRQLQVYTDKSLEKPKIHWLNYALPIAALVIGLAIAAFAILFVITYK